MKTDTRLIRTTLAAAIVMAISASSFAAASAVKLARPGQATGLVFDADLEGVQRVTTPSVDHAKLINEDVATWRPGQPLRFAQPFETRLTPKSHGTWSEQSDGSWLWQLRVASPKAESINLGFTGYRMPEGGELRIRSLTGKTELRPFTAADNQAHGQLWTPIVPGDELMVEVQVPAARREQLALELGAINHAYIEFGKAPAYLKSGSCNVDVVCPEGDAWREQIRSVAVYSRGGSTLCTGALVNNVEQDLKGYFLTANHCGMTVGNSPSMVVYWNFENSTCRAPGSGASGGNGDGQLNQFSTGATFRATRSDSDFALVEINNPIPSVYNAYWAGWDARAGDFPAVIAIHHPNTDEKRISFENNPTTTTGYLNDAVNAGGTHIRVADWDLGTTEPGSSGSPLYSPDGHIIGQLHGGYAACGNNDDDWYGRVSRSWADGGTAATQLRNWLDPNNTGTLVLDGRNEIEGPFQLEVEPAVRSVCRSEGSTQFDVSVLLEGVFNEPVSLSLDGEPAGASIAFGVNPVTGGGVSTATLGNLAALTGGVYPLTFTATSPGEPDAERAAELRLFEAAPAQPSLSSPANGATVSAPVTLAWAADAAADAFHLEVSSTANFSDLVINTLVGGNSHVLPNGLNPATTYYWRVRADNTCGLGSYSTVRSFTTTDEICSAPNLAIPDNQPAGVSDQIIIVEGDELEDLDVSVQINHTYVGDLIVRLTHVETATSIDLIDRPGRTTSGNGCSGANINAVLDDAAAAAVESQCAGGTPTISGTFRPNQVLSAVNGQSLAGTWRLTVSDVVGVDTGTLQRWCLLPTSVPDEPVNQAPMAGSLANVQMGEGDTININAGAVFTDPDGDQLSFDATGLPVSLSIDTSSGIITGHALVGDAGSYAVTVSASDGEFSVDASFTLDVSAATMAIFSDAFEPQP